MSKSTITNQNNLPPSPFLRIKGVCTFLGCGEATVWRWVRAGRLPKPQKLGPRFTVWKRSEIEDFLGLNKA